MVKVMTGEAAKILGLSVDTIRRRASVKKFDERLVGAEWIEDDDKGYWLLELGDDPEQLEEGLKHREPFLDLQGRVEGLERLVDTLLSERDTLRQQVLDAQGAQRELRDLLRQREKCQLVNMEKLVP